MKRILSVILAVSILSSCSVYMAASGDQKRDLNILSPGTHRDMILAEFGAPVSSVFEPAAEEGSTAPSPYEPTAEDGSTRYDIFAFTQGRSTASNAGRAVFYGAAAVLTLGLSEVIATPLEYAVGDQGDIKLRTSYNEKWQLSKSEILDEGTWVSIPEYNQRVLQREKDLNAASGATTN